MRNLIYKNYPLKVIDQLLVIWWWEEIVQNKAKFYISSSKTSLPLAETDCSTKWVPGLIFCSSGICYMRSFVSQIQVVRVQT